MHSSLFPQYAFSLFIALSVQSFEQRVSAIIQSYGIQKRVCNLCAFCILECNGRQLFVIAYKHEFIYCIIVATPGREYSYQVGFKNLRSLVYYCHIEVLYVEQIESVVYGGSRSYEYPCIRNFLFDISQFRTVFQLIFQQERFESSVARHFMPYANKRGIGCYSGINKHAANLIYSPVGI